MPVTTPRIHSSLNDNSSHRLSCDSHCNTAITRHHSIPEDSDVIRWHIVHFLGSDRASSHPSVTLSGDSSVRRVSDWKKQAQYWRRSESLVWQVTFLPQSGFTSDYLPLIVQPPCAIAGVITRSRVKNPTHWQPYHCMDSRKYCIHW